MTDNKNKLESNLYDDLIDVQYDIVWKLHLLIESDWDSKTLKEKLHQLVKQNYNLLDEIDLIEEVKK